MRPGRSTFPPSTALRGPPGALGRRGLASFAEAGGDLRQPEVRDIVGLCAEHAPGLFPLLLSDPAIPADVLARPLEHEEPAGTLAARFREATEGLSPEDDEGLSEALRRLRHRELVRIVLREVLRLADIDQTSAETAELAEGAIDAALAFVRRSLTARYGEVRDLDAGAPVPMTVLGMGKLGGHELNLGSDVDLCFFYETDEAAVGDGDGLVPHELFGRIAARTTKALSEVTQHGFVFRVDLRLRPEGSRGPLVNSLASAERYYETFGQTWERAALLRARPVGGDRTFGERLLATLRPFVFRRRVDPGVAGEMAAMLRRARLELGAADDDVKLGPGGIREAEFFVQSLQLIWGGRVPELQVANTIEAVRRLRVAGLLADRDADRFAAAWALLRRVEHRIHATAGYQTHLLPRGEDAQERMARSLGFRDWGALNVELANARDVVSDLFASLGSPEDQAPNPALVAIADGAMTGFVEVDDLDALGRRLSRVLRVTEPDEAIAHLRRLGRRPESPFGTMGRRSRPGLAPGLLEEVRASTDGDRALRYLADLFGRMGGAWGYDRLLEENPQLARRLVGLFGASPALAEALVRHPESVDNVLLTPTGGDPTVVDDAHRQLVGEAAGNPEHLVALLRRRKRETTLEVGLAFVAGELDLRQVEARLSALAEAQIAAAFRFAREEAERAGGALPAMAVSALGKLGGGELGFGGDLDLFFAYDRRDAQPDDLERATRVAQRTMRLLSQQDAEGEGYETDIRLRPGGSQGMLVVSLAAFDRYHEGRAADWERQALVRARPLTGDPELLDALARRFEDLAFRRGPGDALALAALRARIEEELARERRDRRHPKLGFGALVDVEFLVQYAQMRLGEAHADLRTGHTQDALARLTGKRLIPGDDGEALLSGHRFFRRVEQSLHLVDPGTGGVLPVGGRTPVRVARFLGIRARDGMSPEETLLASWAWHARRIRKLFERHVGPVGRPAPF